MTKSRGVGLGPKPRLFVQVGQRIGAGVVIVPEFRGAPRAGKTYRMARLVCDCGNEYERAIGLLTRNVSPHSSCGCVARKLAAETVAQRTSQPSRKRIDRTGLRYGRLVVVRLGEPRPGSPKILWVCKCDCGKEVTVLADVLGRGDARSCGCLRRKSRLPPTIAPKNKLLHSYKKGAKGRNLPWDLSFEQFESLISKDCFYCGERPSSLISVTSDEPALLYNGIDRLDNVLGYTPENVVTCCKICNRAKSSLPYDVFMAWVGRLTAHQMFSPGSLPSRLLKPAA